MPLFQKMKLEDAVDEFRRQAIPVVAQSDHAGLKQLFSRLSAAARLDSGQAEAAARAALEAELRDAFLSASKSVKRGLFDDLK